MRDCLIPILCYHRVAHLSDGNRHQPLSVPPDVFARQMEYLATHGYQSLPLERLLARPEWVGRRSVVLTFDDGYLDTFEVAFPILQHHGFHFTVFLVNDWLGERDAADSCAPAAMMGKSHVVEMSRQGASFGGHSRSHQPLTDLTPGQLRDEVVLAKSDLERTLGLPTRTFAYPYGLSNQAVRQVATSAGYDLAVAVDNGNTDPYNLHRVVMSRRMSHRHFAWEVSYGPLRWSRLGPLAAASRLVGKLIRRG